jgi:hypothetical protein
MWLVNKDDKKDIKKVFIEPHSITFEKDVLNELTNLPRNLKDWKYFILVENKSYNKSKINNPNIVLMKDNNYLQQLFEKIFEKPKFR